MDFDAAVSKLSRNHSRQVRRNRGKNTLTNSRNNKSLSERAKREAAESTRRYEETKRVERVKKDRLRHAHAYLSHCERRLGTVKIVSDESDSHLFRATSIHGDGDKIALPVSVLKSLMESDDGSERRNSPYEFRVGLPRPGYQFPASPAMVTKMERANVEDDTSDDDNEEEEEEEDDNAAFLEELSYRYLSYTHCTVVEFTQDEGHVGLPRAVAGALLRVGSDVPTTRTVDPASDVTMQDEEDGEEDAERTPGHLAWGAFDVPQGTVVEVSRVTLPKGKGCTLTPTLNAVRQGFHDLKDVKAVLEQSLIRTRATLSLYDTVHCWHRGTKFDLTVSSVTPHDFEAVSCINTDIEVEIGTVDGGESDVTVPKKDSVQAPIVGRTLGSSSSSIPEPPPVGRTLGSSSSHPTPSLSTITRPQQPSSPLPPEPPTTQTSGVCTVQLRGDGKTGRRRFDVRSDGVRELFSWARTVCGDDAFRLVTRFPRRVLTESDDVGCSLQAAGIEEGQEMFMMERI